MTNSKFIPLMVPDIQQQDIDAVVTVLQKGMLIQGKKVEELENNIAKYLGIKHAIAVSSGTATLHLALIALGIGKGDEVIVPAFSYIATANVVELVGAKPIFVDIDIKSFNIDTALIEQAITPATKAIMPVHEFGLACDITEICELAKKHDLKVIEDAACALGAKENDSFAGTFGDVGSFSFHPRKAITSGEGGMLVTNNDKLAKRLRILRNHGIEAYNGKMEFVEAGFNYRLTDFQAALVNSQFSRFDFILECKNKLAEVYFHHLKDLKKIRLPDVPKNKIHSWQSFQVIVDERINRDDLMISMREKGVEINYGAQCMPFQKYFQEKYRLPCERLFPKALNAYKNGIVLPIYERLSSQDVLMVTDIFKELLLSAQNS